MTKFVGVLTSGGDCPGLNAAIRGVGKAALGFYGMQVIGFLDGFRGFMENRTMELDSEMLSGILTQGGTILGTSRDKPHRMPVGGKVLDMTDVIVDNYHKHHLDVLVCLGGGGTQKNAHRLAQRGLNIITLPKTIDNDVMLTDVTFGFDTALSVATEAIDRLHSTAHSHHRIIVVEIMGNKVGWLALGAGIAGGADAILIPEIPYDVESVADAIRRRSHRGKRFSLVAVAEGAISKQDVQAMRAAEQKVAKAKSRGAQVNAEAELERLEAQHAGNTMRLAKQLEKSDRPRVARHDPRLSAARRDAVRGGSAARHTTGHRLCRPHQQGSIRRHGGGARRCHQARAARGRRQKAEVCPA